MAPCPKESLAVVECKGEALPPVLCLSCLAYINQFAKLDVAKSTWECPLCGSDENVLDPKLIAQGGLLSSALSTPIVEFRQEFHAPEAKNGKNSRSIILVFDANLSKEDAKAAAAAVQSVCKETEEETSIGLIVFDKSMAMYQLGLSGMASADVCTIRQANSDEHLANRKSQIQTRPYLATIREGDMSCLWRCISAVYGTDLSDDTDEDESGHEEADPPQSRLEMLKQRKEARKRHQALKEKQQSGSAPQESPWVKMHEKKSSSHPMRCTGEALQCAIDLATISQAQTGSRTQILLFTNGCPNLGDGSVVSTEKAAAPQGRVAVGRVKPDVIDPDRLTSAVQYFEKLAEVAQEHEVGIDVFCSGKCSCSPRTCLPLRQH
jgi:Sec23/Sec24 zinc finger/Sec23/Sec24 trunk domain